MKSIFSGNIRITFGIIVTCLVYAIGGQFVMGDDTSQKELKEMIYSEFLKVRNDADTVVLHAPDIERLFLVVPQEKADAGQGITQVELENALQQIIPRKNTRVILYCYVNFDPLTRRMPARTTVALSLLANGYSNVYELEDLWKDTKLSSTSLKEIEEKEVQPYTKKIPASVMKILDRKINSSPSAEGEKKSQ